MQSNRALGFYHNVEDESVAKGIYDRIQRDHEFTHVLPTGALTLNGVDVILLSLDWGMINYVGLSETISGKATAQRKVNVDHLIPVHVNSDALSAHAPSLRNPNTGDLTLPFGSKRFSGAEWQELWNAVMAVCNAEQRSALAELLATRERRLSPKPAFELDALFIQRDALGLALQASGIDRRRVLSALRQPTAPPQSVVDLLRHVTIEDVFIKHDSVNIPGFVPRDIVGARCVLEGPSTRLTIIQAHRGRLETATGGDLIYYNHKYDAFTVVQYKMMTHDASLGWHFRPGGANYDRELCCMRELRKQILESTTAIIAERSYRLNRDPFFMKLCDRSGDTLRTGQLAAGMYFALEHWDMALADKVTDGVKGGKIVGYGKPDRHINNTDFASMMEHGWVGTHIPSSDVSRLINEFLEAGHVVTIGATGQTVG